MNRRPEYDVKKTGENLKRLRRICGYSADAVRQYVGLGTVQAVYKWERGDCFPTLDNFFALAELYRVNPMDIIVRMEEPHLVIDWEQSRKEQEKRLFYQYYCLIQKSCSINPVMNSEY